MLTFKALNGLGPTYLRDRLFRYSPPRLLRSADQNLLRIPGPKDIKLTSTRARAFLALAPAWWNELPIEIQALTKLLKFRKACKTVLFHQAMTKARVAQKYMDLPPPLSLPYLESPFLRVTSPL